MTGDSRFEIRRTLGEGGMGVVYEARDTTRDMIVALKTLRVHDANLLYHFKNEFRSLADLSHANLCNLYELFETHGQWFFTMELVEGCDFMSWIRPRGVVAAVGTPAPDSGTMLEFVAPGQTVAAKATPLPPSPTSPLGFDEPRLRESLAQLARGLNALHAAGKVHRDIKPGNILVTPTGRVVIMDFGLVADAALLAELLSLRAIAGTPAFMAPEQGVPGATVGASADWYAVGVMLYQILTNRLPFEGGTLQELTAAKRLPPTAPSTLAFGVPADLEELCERLLAPDPALRPDGDAVLRLLGGKVTRRRAPAGDVFVGRRAELGLLHTALADSRRGAVTVFVEGASGLGKTALVRRFLDEVAGSGTMVLTGRCYAEETVPYKAFDGIVDALSRSLVTMDRQREAELVPQSAALAARLFPVLLRVRSFAHATQQGSDTDISGIELRSRAFAALVGVLARVAASQPLLLFVDDLQWADPDSLLLLRELLHASHAPPLAFVASVRPEQATEIAKQARIEPTWIRLAPLAPDDAAQLVERLLPRDTASLERRQEIAREAAGHPLFLAELAHHQASHGGELNPRLDEALWQRTMALEPDSRRLLQLVAVAGTPIDQRTIADAAGLSPTRCAPLFAALRGERFVKTSINATGANVEPYHDRVRESIVTRLEREVFTTTSSHLAHAMLRAGMGETAPELVVRHLFAAGDVTRGRDLAERAAGRALATLAFDRAAEFLRSALGAGPRDAAHARALHLALAEALANGGRGAEAADAFLAAGGDVADEVQLDCRRRAADQLLVTGHVARGLEELGGVLAQLGDHIPDSPQESLASLEAVRAILDAKPIRLEERALAEIPAPLLRKLDVYQSTSLGLVLVDNVRGADFQARATRLALAAGEPGRAQRALVFEAIYRAQEGTAGRSRSAELQAIATDIARGRNDPWMDAYLVLASAFYAYYTGKFRRAVELFKDADVRFRVFTGVAWEQNTIRLHRLRATDYLGAWGELRSLYDEYLRDAQRRDDLYVEASLTRWFNVLWLAHDRPDLAGADLDQSEWTAPDERRYHLQHFLELRARVELALYRGEGAAQGVWARPGLASAERSHLLRIQIARAIADWLLGRIAACEGAIDEAEHRARLLVDQRINYAAIWGGFLEAAATHQRGDQSAAVAKLDAIAAAADHDFPLCAAIARLRSGQLLGTADGEARIAAATAWMTAEDIRNPLRMCDVFAPGFQSVTMTSMS
ncbi:MAG: AAA family ATPase [Kofleriaceae bacterium]